MKGTNLGELEELVLMAVAGLQENAYSLALTDEINRVTKRNVSFGVVHSALNRLEKKGYLKSEMGGASAVRGGRRKRIYTISTDGKKALITSKEQRDTMWAMIPKVIFDKL